MGQSLDSDITKMKAFASVLALVGLTQSAPAADVSSHVVHHGHHGAVLAHHAPHHLAHPVPLHHAVHAPVHHAVHAPVHHAPVHHAVHHAPVHHAVHHAPVHHAVHAAPVIAHPTPYAPAPVVRKPAYA